MVAGNGKLGNDGIATVNCAVSGLEQPALIEFFDNDNRLEATEGAKILQSGLENGTQVNRYRDSSTNLPSSIKSRMKTM